MFWLAVYVLLRWLIHVAPYGLFLHPHVACTCGIFFHTSRSGAAPNRQKSPTRFCKIVWNYRNRVDDLLKCRIRWCPYILSLRIYLFQQSILSRMTPAIFSTSPIPWFIGLFLNTPDCSHLSEDNLVSFIQHFIFIGSFLLTSYWRTNRQAPTITARFSALARDTWPVLRVSGRPRSQKKQAIIACANSLFK